MLVIPRLIEAVIRSIFVPSASSVFFKVAVASRCWCSASERRRDASATLTLSRHQRKETERFKCFAYDDLVERDMVNLDIFWLKDESLEDSANLPAPDIIAAEIVEDLEAALAQFAEIASDLGEPGKST
jgi:hypothetical protein